MRVVDQVLDAFGGNHQRMADAAGVSRQAIYRWFMPDMGYVPNREPAIELAKALLKMGKPISAARLMALEDSDDTQLIGGGAAKRHRRGRAFQKQACPISLVESVNRAQATKQEMRAIEGGRQLRVGVAELASHKLQRLAANE